MMSARAAQGAPGTKMMFGALRRPAALLALALAALPLAAPALAQQPAPAQPAAPAQPKDDALTPPPVVDPKPVETTPIAPPSASFIPEELTLAPVPVLALSGHATWEEAYDKLVATMKALDKELSRLGLARAGDAMVVYTASDDLGFDFEAQLPFSGTTTQKPEGSMKLGGSYAGKVLKFSHSGSFADMDNTYEQIANYLDEKNITADELYVERYRTDLSATAPDALKIEILVPVPK
ncbi:GyrI-like domain-containing protein [Xanthobacter sp. V0B-10]|uniref:GyrI-like domain-containing protein n=1 Tax=Xanthobacter albus TaxID=3119929 RepID=UPI003728101A